MRLHREARHPQAKALILRMGQPSHEHRIPPGGQMPIPIWLQQAQGFPALALRPGQSRFGASQIKLKGSNFRRKVPVKVGMQGALLQKQRVHFIQHAPRPRARRTLSMHPNPHQRLGNVREPPPSRDPKEQFRILEHGFRMGMVKGDYRNLGINTPEELEKVRAILVRQIDLKK